MEEDSSESVSSGTDEDVSDDERSKIRANLSTMTFEDLQKLKDQVGSKLFNKAISKTDDGGDKDRTKRRRFKRANKNRPREESSKRRPPKNSVVGMAKKQITRDPRFDPLCGAFDNKVFQHNYRFVNDLRKKERREIEKIKKSTNDPKEKKKLSYIAQRLDNQIHEHEKKMKEEQEKFVERNEIKDKLKRGEKPHFKKKSVKKLENLVNQYENLKKNNKIEKHIMKRSKKLMKKDEKQLGQHKFFE